MTHIRRPDELRSDLGPSIRRQRGEVVVLDAPDPEQPNRTVRRARRVWAPDVLLANGTIHQAHHDAATRYHDSYALGILGARQGIPERVDRSMTPQGLADARLAAATDYRRATQAVGMVAATALSWCVLSNGSVAGWAQCKGWSKDKAGGYLLSALDRLAEHYGLT